MQDAQTQRKTIGFGQRATRMFYAMVDIFSLGVAVLLIANLTIGERLNVIALTNNLLHLLLLLTPLALLVALPLRRFGSIVLLLGCIGFTANHYLPNFLPRTPPQVAGREVTLFTQNLFARYNSDDLDDVVALIREVNADIVLLQEVGFAAEEALMEPLSDVYPHASLHPQEWANAGQGVLSKFPITQDEFWQYEGGIYLGHQRVALDIASTPVIIYNIHPLHPGMVMLDVSERTADLNTVLTRVENDPADVPIIIGGDMNMTDLTADYRRIRQLGFSDAHKEAGRGFGFTFPAVGAPPLIRLDQIFYNSYWTAIEAEVIPQGNGSDHFPVRVVLDLNTQ